MKLEYLTGLELGELVNTKQVSATEVVDYFAARIEERNPSVNAIVYTRIDEAKEAAQVIEDKIARGEDVGPFAGVPVGLKDFLPSKKGWTASHGGVKSLITTDDADSTFCQAAEQLGAVVIGKTNAPSFGFRGTCDNKMYGATSTPFNVDYNSGGSSGGSASAVADGMLTMAEGGDAGGSTRIPSAWCGTFGYKPSAGVVPSVCRPDAWTATHPYCCSGPITRSVMDAAYMFNSMQRYDPRDPISVKSTPLDLAALQDTSSLKGLKVGVTLDFNLFPRPEFEIETAIIHTASILKDLGADVEEVNFNIHTPKHEIEAAWLRSISVDTSIDLELWKQNGFDLIKDHSDELPAEFIYWNDIAIKSTMLDYRKFHEIRTDILDAHLDVLDKYDIILAPVTGCMPVKNNKDSKGPSEINGVKVDPLIGFGYTYLENFIGTPAASIPVSYANGLPIGAQIIGRRYEDATVFKVCRALEIAKPWNYVIPANRI